MNNSHIPPSSEWQMPEWISNLIEFAVNPLNDRLISTLLILASIMLTVVSFTTTYQGLHIYFTDWYYAAMAALAIQTLLFATSWRIGAALASKFFSFSLLGIYLVTMLVSVFFSYVAFFESIHPQAKRSEATAKVLRSSAQQKTNEMLILLSNKIEDTYKNSATGIQTWATRVLADLSYFKAIASLNTEKGEETAKALSEKAKDEENFGGTDEPSPTGRGHRYDGIISERNKQRIAAAQNRGIEKSFSETFKSLNDHITDISNFFAGKSDKLPSASQLQADCYALRALVQTSNLTKDWKPSANCDEATTFIPSLSESTTHNNMLKLAQAACNTAITKTQEEVINTKIQESYSECWTRINESAKSIKDDTFDTKWQDNLVKNLEWTSSDAHVYTQAVGYLMAYGHPMAIGSLILAFIVDLLVLLCAFLGARPRSHLDLRKPSDLYGVEEEAILTSIFFADWEGYSDNPFARQIANIRREVCFDPTYAKEGFAGYIIINTDSKQGSKATEGKESPQKITYMMSLLIAMELAAIKTRKEGDKEVTVIALRVRLMLWLADLIANQSQTKHIGQVGRKLMKELSDLSNYLNAKSGASNPRVTTDGK